MATLLVDTMSFPDDGISQLFSLSSGSCILSWPSSEMFPESWRNGINVWFKADTQQSLILSTL